MTGRVEGPVDFGGGTLQCYSSSNIFIAKYSANGDHLWSKCFGSNSSGGGNAITTDASGNVVVTGYFGGTVDFGGGPLNSLYGNNIFVAKYSANGSHLWSKSLGTPNPNGITPQAGLSVVADSTDNVVVTGNFAGTADFGGGPLSSAGGYDIFVAKYSANGSYLWSKRFGNTSDDFGYGVAVDANDNIIVTGSFGGTVNFGGGLLTSSGGSDIFVARYSANGSYLWSKRFGGPGKDEGHAVAVDVANGDIIITGMFNNTVDFGGGPFTCVDLAGDIFVARYSANGSYLWSKRFGGVNNFGGDSGEAVAVDASGNVVVTGYFYGTSDFGGGSLISAGGYDIFVAKYSASGAHLASQGLGGIGTDQGFEISLDDVGNAVLTGRFQCTVDFGNGPLTSSSNSFDIFLVKLDP
jgi:uncharacterized protein (AIM24 family)